MGLFAIPPIVDGPKKYKVLGIIALLIAIALAGADYNAGKRWRDKREAIRKRHKEQVNPVEEGVRPDSDKYRKETNAYLENDELIWPPSDKKGDVTLKGRFKEQVELQKIKDGDWYRYLYKITYDEIEVVNGEWKYQELSFLCKDTWPTEESGIMVKKLPWPFRENECMIFEIDQKNNKNLIIGYKKADIAP